MTYRLVKQRALHACRLTCRVVALAMIATGTYLAMTDSQARAAVPVSSIKSCETAVAAVNAGLTTVSRSRLALKAAKKSRSKSAIKRAKTRLAAAEAQRDTVRAKVKSLCAAGGVTAQSGGCNAAIDKLGATIEALAAGRTQLEAVRPSAKNAKALKAKLRAVVRKRANVVERQSEAMRAACTPAQTASSVVTAPVGAPTPPVDTAAPTVKIKIVTPTKDTTPTVELEVSELATVLTCKLDGADHSTAALAFSLPPQSEGAHSFSCFGTDAAGNVGEVASKSFVIDTIAPGLPLITGPIETNSTHLTFWVANPAGSTAGDTAKCRADGQPYEAAPNLQFIHDFTVGAHVVNCILSDAAGNESLPGALLVTVLP